MKFTFITSYDQKVLTAMARTLRKTARKKRSFRAHFFGWIVVAFGIFLLLPLGEDNFEFSFRTILTLSVILILLLVLLKEDSINGYISRKRLLPQLQSSTTVFSTNDAEYHSSTQVGNSDFRYDNIIALAETADYFVFIFSESHAQIYDKSSITGGTTEDFRNFIQSVTGLSLQQVS